MIAVLHAALLHTADVTIANRRNIYMIQLYL